LSHQRRKVSDDAKGRLVASSAFCALFQSVTKTIGKLTRGQMFEIQRRVRIHSQRPDKTASRLLSGYGFEAFDLISQACCPRDE